MAAQIRWHATTTRLSTTMTGRARIHPPTTTATASVVQAFSIATECAVVKLSSMDVASATETIQPALGAETIQRATLTHRPRWMTGHASMPMKR